MEQDKEADPETLKATRKTCRKYKKEDMDKFFQLVEEKKMSIRSAAAEIKVPKSTAYDWYKEERESLGNDENIVMGEAKSGAKKGRSAILNDTHKEYLVSLIDEQSSLVLDEIVNGLVSQFVDLKIFKTALYEFVTEKCQINLKRAHFYSVERNYPEKIEERYHWVTQWENTDLNFESNCVFIDKAGFHINVKRSLA
ncbi:unnamed protein product [Rhizopus stolonifer]